MFFNELLTVIFKYILSPISAHRPFSSSRNVANVDALNSAYGYGNKFAVNRPGSMSETNLLKYRPHKDGGPTSTVRPESALGLLQGAFHIVVCRVLEFKYPRKKNIHQCPKKCNTYDNEMYCIVSIEIKKNGRQNCLTFYNYVFILIVNILYSVRLFN